MTGSDAGQQLRDLVRSLPQETTRQISAETLLSVVQEKIEPEPSKPRIESVTDDSEKPQEKIAPKADKATAVNGGKFMYTGTDKPLGVVFGGKELYLENDCLVTNFPECGALMLDGVSAKWNGILLEESAGKFLACAPMRWDCHANSLGRAILRARLGHLLDGHGEL